MNEIQKIETAVTETLRNEEFQSVTTDIAEAILDSTLTDGLLKDIPGFSSIIGIAKTVFSVRDAMFVKKLIYFLTQLKDIPSHERKEMLDEIDSSKKYKIRVGEKLLFIIEKCQDTEKAEICGKLFKAFITGELNYDEFLRVSDCIEFVYIPDLLKFVDDRWEETDVKDDIASLATAGIVRIGYIKPFDNSVEGITDSEIIYRTTEIGDKLRKILTTKPMPIYHSLF